MLNGVREHQKRGNSRTYESGFASSTHSKPCRSVTRSRNLLSKMQYSLSYATLPCAHAAGPMTLGPHCVEVNIRSHDLPEYELLHYAQVEHQRRIVRSALKASLACEACPARFTPKPGASRGCNPHDCRCALQVRSNALMHGHMLLIAGLFRTGNTGGGSSALTRRSSASLYGRRVAMPSPVLRSSPVIRSAIILPTEQARVGCINVVERPPQDPIPP